MPKTTVTDGPSNALAEPGEPGYMGPEPEVTPEAVVVPEAVPEPEVVAVPEPVATQPVPPDLKAAKPVDAKGGLVLPPLGAQE